MQLKPLLNELFAMTFHAGIKPGLERIIELCEHIGNPQFQFPVIHVAGTNGKGTTCSVMASILMEAGYKVGLYTSPHVRDFNERIRINGVAISDDDILRLAPPLMQKTQEIEGTFFEVTTALAFQYFAERRVDIAVIETGLGGTYDATNIVQPIASVITQIDLDHKEFLGNTLEQIAGEKAGIIKQGAVAVVGHRSGLRSIFTKAAQLQDTSVMYVEDEWHADVVAFHPDLKMSIAITHNDTRTIFATDVVGTHQAQNICTALCALAQLNDVLFINEDHIERGLLHITKNSGLQARISLLQTHPPLVIDVAHNPAGIIALVETLQNCGYNSVHWNIVFAAMADKDIPHMLESLLPIVGSIHLCAPNYKRAMPVEELCGITSVVMPSTPTFTYPSVATAIDGAIEQGAVIICGSFYLLEEALEHLNKPHD